MSSCVVKAVLKTLHKKSSHALVCKSECVFRMTYHNGENEWKAMNPSIVVDVHLCSRCTFSYERIAIHNKGIVSLGDVGNDNIGIN